MLLACKLNNNGSIITDRTGRYCAILKNNNGNITVERTGLPIVRERYFVVLTKEGN